MLAWTIYVSFVGVGLLLCLPMEIARAARIVALLTAMIGFLVALAGVMEAKAGELQTITKIPWIPSLGIEYHLAAWHQFDSCLADWSGGYRRHLVLLEHRASREGVFYVL